MTFASPVQTAPVLETPPKVLARNVNVHYGEKHALKDVSVDIPARAVTAFIGPSGWPQVDLPALHQPDERHDPDLSRHR